MPPAWEIGRIARAHDVLFHTDAVQVSGAYSAACWRAGCGLVVVERPQVLWSRRHWGAVCTISTALGKFMHGGGHEKDMRAGITTTPAIVGMGAASEIALRDMEKNAKHEAALTKRLADALLKLPETRLNSDALDKPPDISTSASAVLRMRRR